MRAIVAVAADKGRTGQEHPRHRELYPIYSIFYEPRPPAAGFFAEAFPLRSSPLPLRGDRLF